MYCVPILLVLLLCYFKVAAASLLRLKLLPSLVALPAWAAGFHKVWAMLGWQVCIHYGWEKKEMGEHVAANQSMEAKLRVNGCKGCWEEKQEHRQRKQQKKKVSFCLHLSHRCKRTQAPTCLCGCIACAYTHTCFGLLSSF